MQTITEVQPITRPPVLESEALKVVDMPDTVLDGRLGEICQRRLGDLPLAYSYLALVTCAGTLVPTQDDTGGFLDDATLFHRNNTIRTNLFFCPVGEIGTGK